MLYVSDHPLILHKLAILRDQDTGNKKFRELTSEITTMLVYEATRQIKTTPKQVTTPMGPADCHELARETVFAPVLRAGLGMLDASLKLAPTASVGYLGMQRNHTTHEPEDYYINLPNDTDANIYILDPMLATGGSIIASISKLQEQGYANISVVSIVSSQEGVDRVSAAHPDIDIFTAAVDAVMNDDKYIIPGLGDAGDRLYGTE